MTNILYMAISRDGFIAGKNDETPWSDESWNAFAEFVKSCDVVLLGRRTYKIMKDGDEFVDGPKYIVVTNDSSLDTGTLEKLAVKTARDIPAVNKLGIIGGGDLNGRLAELGVIDEVILDKEPIKLHEGIKLYGNHQVSPKLELINQKDLNDTTTQYHYRVTSNLPK